VRERERKREREREGERELVNKGQHITVLFSRMHLQLDLNTSLNACWAQSLKLLQLNKVSFTVTVTAQHSTPILNSTCERTVEHRYQRLHQIFLQHLPLHNCILRLEEEKRRRRRKEGAKKRKGREEKKRETTERDENRKGENWLIKTHRWAQKSKVEDAADMIPSQDGGVTQRLFTPITKWCKKKKMKRKGK
jgi:hypothetical protein